MAPKSRKATGLLKTNQVFQPSIFSTAFLALATARGCNFFQGPEINDQHTRPMFASSLGAESAAIEEAVAKTA